MGPQWIEATSVGADLGEGKALIAETFNGTCWKAVKKRIRESVADVFAAQEVRLLPQQLPAARAWCARQGLKATFAPACPSAKNGLPSGGVAIIVRDWLSLTAIDDKDKWEIAPHRALAAKVVLPGLGPVVLATVYMDVSGGFREANLRIMASLAAETLLTGLPFLWLRDFNVAASSWAAPSTSVSEGPPPNNAVAPRYPYAKGPAK